jgi:hypothetical protein
MGFCPIFDGYVGHIKLFFPKACRQFGQRVKGGAIFLADVFFDRDERVLRFALHY